MKQSVTTMFPTLAFSRFADHMSLNCLSSMHQQVARPRLGAIRQRQMMAQEMTLHLPSSALFAEDSPSAEDSSKEEQDPSMFFELMSPIESVKPDQMSASSLAYLGDVVFELFVRSRYVWPSRRMSDLQNTVVAIVRGKYHMKVQYL